MATNVDFQVPFLPQTGITQQVLAAIQLANEHNIARQRLAQQAPLVQAQTGEAQARTAELGAETAAIPKRLELQQQEIEATTRLREATLNVEQQFRMGMLKVRQTDEDRKIAKDASDKEIKAFQAVWTSKLDQAKIGGIAGGLQLRRDALAQERDLTEQSLQLRGQANQLREQGLDIQADAVNARADDIVNKVGIIRNITNTLGLTEGRTPNAANPPAPTRTPAAKTPKPLPPGAVPGTLNGKHGYSLNGKFVED